MSQHLREDLATLCGNFQIPTQMMELGIDLLDRSIDFQRCNENTLGLRSDGQCHLIEPDHRCENAVYLLIKNVGDVQFQLSNPFHIGDHIRVYGGQTSDFRIRERNRSNHPMVNSDVKICLCHGLTTFQRDCLELALIGFLLLNYGLKVTNKCIYPMHIYTNITDDINIFDIQSHSRMDDAMVNTYRLMRRVLIVGTAPPQRLLGSVIYARNLREWQVNLQQARRIANPLLDWDDETARSRSIRELRGWFESEDGDLPNFINHYPGFPSDNMQGLCSTIDLAATLEADRQVRTSVQILDRDVIVMLGARPTRLFPRTLHDGYFFAQVCSKIDLHWLSPERCAFTLWWPDHGLRNHSHRPAMMLLEQVWVLLAHKLHLLLFMVHLASPNEPGVPADQATNIIQYLSRSPTTLQLEGLLKRLNVVWMADRLQQVPIRSSFQFQVLEAQAALEQVTLPANLPRDEQQAIIMSAIHDDEQAPLTVYETIRNWSRASQTTITNRIMNGYPGFNALSEAEQVQLLRQEAVNESNRLSNAWMNNHIQQGLFETFPNETPEAQRQRWQLQLNLQRISRPYSETATIFTCPWCSQLIAKKLQGRKLTVGSRPANCPVGAKHVLGWSLVPGNHQDYYPQNNVFLGFFNSLPPITIVNIWQLSVAFADYLFQIKNDNPQADIIYQEYEDIFPTIQRFQSQGTLAPRITAFKTALQNAMERLARLSQPCDVIIRQRAKFHIEMANFRNAVVRQTLIGFKLHIEGQQFLLAVNEDFDYQNYRQVLEHNTGLDFDVEAALVPGRGRRRGRIGMQRRGGEASRRRSSRRL